MLQIKITVFVLVALACCITLSAGQASISRPQTHPDHPGKCWSKETSKAYAVGEKFRDANQCSQTTCNSDFSFTSIGCGLKVIDDPSCHKIDHDLSLPYPDCCVQYECTDAQGKVTRI